MKNLNDLMRKAQDLQSKMAQVQNEIQNITVEAQAGGGLVKVQLRGQGKVESIKIDKSLLNPEEGDVLEDLIVAATNNAREQLDQKTAEMMQTVAGGMGLPGGGFKLPF